MRSLAQRTSSIECLTAGACLVLCLVQVVAGSQGPDPDTSWSFRNDVQPVLAKAGCSAGACHGAAAGQGGFRLSLRGYDDEGDHASITRSALGRRIDSHHPALSLLLLKPTGAVPHKGGERFTTNSLEYRILSEWIAAGAPAPQAADPRIEKLDILPNRIVLQPGMQQQFSVKAHFSDGTARDVTQWVKYTDANSAVTSVSESGSAKIQGFGEGAITAWYLSRLAIARVIVPYTNNLSSLSLAQARKRNFIDEQVALKLNELNLPPSPRCSDAEFVRRAHLDTIGVLPTPSFVRSFLEDKDPDKRDRLIETLLRRPEFTDYWTYKWSDLLLVSSERLRPDAMWSYHHWIRTSVAANKPWDQMVRDIVTASGSTLENGAANFFALHQDPTGMAETVTQAFLGMSVNCAKCHNHPMEKWTNDEYFGFANLFARVRTKNGEGDGAKIIFAAPSGDINQPLRGRPQPPKPLDGEAVPLDSAIDRRQVVANWLTSPKNPYFTRSIVNRVWANFMGVGLVEKVDDLRITNPASNEDLLSALADHLSERRYDLKALMRAILQSETYQRSSEPLKENSSDTRFYARYYPRRLAGEVLLDAFSQVTGVPTVFQIDLRNANQGLGQQYPVGIRALQLPDTRVFSYFLKTFGRPDREKTCECERSAEPNMAQVLHIANGDTVNQKLTAPGNVLTKWLDHKFPPEKLIEELYLTAVSRFPTPRETEQLSRVLSSTQPEERRQALEDLCWAVLSSKEFLFNH
ncbi:MAG: DUF1553 domain-containing protein [Verrucomicrobiales bacterium]|nr:DUF1553 domain-containing protein [Verrucomicrobiales bacterium]